MGDNWWVTRVLENGGPVFLASEIVLVLGSIILHELAHGFMAIRCGDDTPQTTGHMTINPIVHMGGFGLIMFALCGIAFGQMPVNPRRFRGRYDDAKVAFAGPAMNFILAFCAVIAFVLFLHFGRDTSEKTFNNVANTLWYGATLNFVLGFFNLLPVMPLDGSTILARFSNFYRDTFTGPQARQMSSILLILLFLYGSDKVWGFATQVAEKLVHGINGLFF